MAGRKSGSGAKGAGYKLATYRSSEGPRAGLVIGEEVFDAAKLTGKPAYSSVLGILEDWKTAEGALKKAAAKRRQEPDQAPAGEKDQVPGAGALSLGDLLRRRQLRRPCRRNGGARRPPAAARSAYQGLKAWHFLKASRTLTDPGAPVKISDYAKQMDWEIELVAVIGKVAKNVPLAKALSYVAGYTIGNDLSARDRGRRANVPDTSPFKWDWTKHKSFDGSCPLGPWIVPAADIGDPQNLGLKLWVNGEIKQDSNTSGMIFTLAEQIEEISAGMTLYPGDLIMTGTPAGVGAGRGEFLKAGDVVKLWIEKIGEIENRMT